MRVTLVGCTTGHFANMERASGGKWEPEGDGTAQDLIEFAGRACYRSWGRPNAATASNAGYIGNIIAQEHFSVLEHGSVSFYIEHVSRSLTHELVRHRHFSFSQLSQRYVEITGNEDFVVPPLFDGNDKAEAIMTQVWLMATRAYLALEEEASSTLAELGVVGTAARKQAREAARAVLPNMTPTSVVVTGNHRSWREFIAKRGTVHADAEIRELAVEVFQQLAYAEPNMYQDMKLTTVNHGGGPVIIVDGS